MNFENYHLLAFPPIESDLSVVRPPRLLWEIDMIISKLPDTNFMWWKAKENFLERPEVTVFTLWNSLFEVFRRGKISVWVWFSKNHHWLAFATVESFLSVVRPSRLLWEIDMIIRMLANIHIMSWKVKENFLEGPEVTVVTLWNPLFEVNRSSGTYFWVWFPKNHH